MSVTRRIRRGLLHWLPAIGLMALIFTLSSQSGLRVSDDAGVDRPARTIAHLLIYLALAAAFVFALGVRPGRAARVTAVAFALAVLFGTSDEVHQAFVPERTAELSDLAVDAAGAAIGAVTAALVLSRR